MICKQYVNNIDIESISKNCGVSKATVHRILQRNKISRTRPTGPRTKITCQEDYFDKIDTSDKAYWLGFIYADGNVRRNKSGSFEFSLRLSDVDKYHLELFLEHIKSKHEIKIKKEKNKKRNNFYMVASIRIVRKKITDALIKHGVIPRKTYYIEFPHVNKKLFPHFIRRYFDGDGGWHIRKRKGKLPQLQFAITSASIKILNSIRDLLVKECGVNKNKIYSDRKSKAFRLTYEGNKQCRRIYDFLFTENCTCLRRKLKQVREHFALEKREKNV